MKLEILQNNVVQNVLDKLFSAKLPIKLAYRLCKAQKVVIDEMKSYQDLRMKIIEANAERDEAGQIKVSEEGNVQIKNMESFVEEMKALHDVDVDLGIKIKIEEIESLELSANDMMCLVAAGLLDEPVDG